MTEPNSKTANPGHPLTLGELFMAVREGRLTFSALPGKRPSQLPSEIQDYKWLLGYCRHTYRAGVTLDTLHQLAADLRVVLGFELHETDRLNRMSLREVREALTKPAAADKDEYARFVELHAMACSSDRHRVSLETSTEYDRLKCKYGVYTVDLVPIGPPDPLRVPRSVPIFNTDCIPIAGNKPLICPRAKPKLPPELLPGVEQRWRELRLTGPGRTVLWVGRQAEMETLCMWNKGCDCFEAKPSAASTSDNAEYVLVSELWPSRSEFHRPSDVTKFLKRIPNEPAPTGIRNRRKGQRRFVHEADWHRYFREKDRMASELLDDEALQEKLADIEAQKAIEREQKKRGK
jgi:hypothetical protein